MSIEIGVISIFPEMFHCLKYGVVARAFENNLAILKLWNPRDWAVSDYGQIDDRPYGGGPGMVMMYEPLHQAIQHARQEMPARAKTIYLSPQGKKIKQHDLMNYIENRDAFIFIAGRYEGIDERLFISDIDEEWSLGDFVLSGGEIAAMACIDAMLRLIPGVLNDPRSHQQDSFAQDILDYPHYTRPAEIAGLKVPDVLLSGSHRAIEQWRRAEALKKTWDKRPDLLEKLDLSPEDKKILAEFKQTMVHDCGHKPEFKE